MNKLKCIIIEDERPAREVLLSFIARVEWLELAGTFEEAMSAMSFLREADVDLVFLDIQIPGMSGLDMLKTMNNPPPVIITTAYSNYAVEAFELDVRDYLKKPISFHFLKRLKLVKNALDGSILIQIHGHLSQVLRVLVKKPSFLTLKLRQESPNSLNFLFLRVL